MTDIWNALLNGLTYSFFLRLFFGTAMFCLWLKRKKHFWLRMGGCMASYLGIAVIFMPFHTEGILASSVMYVGWFTFSFLWLYFCFEEPPQAILFCCISGYTTQQIAGSANVLLQHAFQYFSLDAFSPFPDYPFLSWLYTQSIHIAVYVTIYFTIARKLKTGNLALKRGQLIIISMVALFADILLQLIAIEHGILAGGFASSAVILCYNILSCLLIYYLLFSSLSNKHLQEDISSLQQLLAQQQRQYMLSKETIDNINIKCHDLRHQVRKIAKGTSLDQETIQEIEDTISIYDATVKTGNDALDVILTEKSLICNEQHIRITCIADGAALAFMKESDIYTLFGNALDNAIEAVMKLTDEDRRLIGIKVRSDVRYIMIHIYNCFSTPVSFDDGHLKTSKSDSLNHGFGVRSMTSIVDKYHGNLSIKTEDDIFHLTIVFQK